jgi:hypothetical protein
MPASLDYYWPQPVPLQHPVAVAPIVAISPVAIYYSFEPHIFLLEWQEYYTDLLNLLRIKKADRTFVDRDEVVSMQSPWYHPY